MFNQRNRSRPFSFDAPRNQRSFLGKMGKFMLLVFSLMMLAGLVLFGISSCENAVTHKQTLAYVSKNECEFRYEGVGLTLIENHCGKDAGLYFMTPAGLQTAPLIDPVVSDMVKRSGCAAPNHCAFHLKVRGQSVSGQFNYTLNGKEGFYNFEWPADEQPRLVESSDSPNKS